MEGSTLKSSSQFFQELPFYVYSIKTITFNCVLMNQGGILITKCNDDLQTPNETFFCQQILKHKEYWKIHSVFYNFGEKNYPICATYLSNDLKCLPHFSAPPSSLLFYGKGTLLLCLVYLNVTICSPICLSSLLYNLKYSKITL